MNRTIIGISLMTLLWALVAAQPAEAARPFYVELEANGVPIEGEPSFCPPSGSCPVGGVDVQGQIEGLSFDYKVNSVGGRVGSGEIRIVKRVDKSTPLLHRALDQSQVINATIRFFRENANNGKTEIFHIMTLSDGSITGIAPWLTTGVGGGDGSDPFLEAFTISFQELRITAEPSGNEHEYTFSPIN